MILVFPQMHPTLLSPAARAALPKDARHLDPGLAPRGDSAFLRPPAAPFDERAARGILADTLRFGQSVANPRDILARSLVEQAGALNTEGSGAVQAEVERRLLGETEAAVTDASAGSDPLDVARRQAQTVLLLAWNLEELLLELSAARKSMDSAWSRLGESVALGEGEFDEDTDHAALELSTEMSGIALPLAGAATPPWHRLLACFGVLAPEAVLATTDAEIGAALAEAGVPEAPLDEFPGAGRVYRAPIWRMTGFDRAPEGKPWLDVWMTLGVFAPGAE